VIEPTDSPTARDAAQPPEETVDTTQQEPTLADLVARRRRERAAAAQPEPDDALPVGAIGGRDAPVVERLLQAMPEDIAARIHVAAAEQSLPPVDPGTAREQVEAEQREILTRSRRELWADVLARWPDDDFQGVTLDGLLPEQKPGHVRAWLDDPAATILVLAGPTGRGKTRIGFAVGNLLAESGTYCYAISHNRWLDSLKPDGSDEPPWKIRRRVQNAEFLIVDDFGAELDPAVRVSEFVGRETTDMLSARLRPGKRTIITTNRTSEQLAVMFSDRIISRLKQGSTALIIQGPDWRVVDAGW
jgi:hypothetical protein